MEYNQIYYSSLGNRCYIDENGDEYDDTDIAYERAVDDALTNEN